MKKDKNIKKNAKLILFVTVLLFIISLIYTTNITGNVVSQSVCKVNNAVYIDEKQRVGIGTTTPTQDLDISGVMKLTPTGSPGSCSSLLKGSI